MKHLKHPKELNKSLFIVLLLLLCVSFLAVGTYAAYTTSSSVKQVVRARTQDANADLRFSSNLLFNYGLDVDAYEERSISVSNSGDVTIDITVCNYPQNAPASFNDKDIHYTMSVTAEGTGITCEPQGGDLKGGKLSSVTHSITIPAESVSAVSSGYLTVVVTPDEGSREATKGKKLAAKLKIVPEEILASGWNGDLKFEGNSEKNDAINFYIYGTGEYDMVLSWGDKVKLGDWSKELLGLDPTAKSPVTIHVGGPGQPNSYYLQFYRLGPASEYETKESLGISFEKVS